MGRGSTWRLGFGGDGGAPSMTTAEKAAGFVGALEGEGDGVAVLGLSLLVEEEVGGANDEEGEELGPSAGSSAV